jgi:hypothetical protein
MVNDFTEGLRPALWASVGISLAMFVHSVLLPQSFQKYRFIQHLFNKNHLFKATRK